MRLYLGAIVMTEEKPGVTHNYFVKYVNWKSSEAEARGEWVAHAMAAHPQARVSSIAIDDITDIARADPNG